MRRTPLLLLILLIAVGSVLFFAFGRPTAPPTPAQVPSAGGEAGNEKAGDAPTRRHAEVAARTTEPSASPPVEPATEPSTGTAIPTATFVEPSDARIAQPEHVVRGRILRPGGEPVGGADVRLVSLWLPAGLARRARFRTFQTSLVSGPPLMRVPHVMSLARTGDDGAFEVRYREGGPRSLIVLIGGRPVRILEGISDDSVHDIVVSDDLPTVAGRVVRSSGGTPVAGASILYRAELPVLLPQLPGSGLLVRRTTTDAEGRWRLHPPAGPAKLHIVSADAGSLYDEWIDVPSAGVLEVEHALSGHDTNDPG